MPNRKSNNRAPNMELTDHKDKRKKKKKKGAAAGVMASESRYRNPALTVDAAVVRHKENQEGNKQLQVLLIRRKGSTFYNHLAFPGGFVDYGEAPENACLRELQEETCLVGKNPKLIGVYGDPQRDILFFPIPFFSVFALLAFFFLFFSFFVVLFFLGFVL
ncbi:NUDIX hydrolase [Balamuthia mandrillaris]